jgi:hypothetical protein
MPDNGLFLARYVSNSADNIYRIYARAGDLFFINVGGLNATTKVITSQFGLIGMLIAASLAKRAKRRTEAILQSLEAQDPEYVLSRDKTSFKVYVPEISESTIEPPSFFAMHGKQAGSWSFKLRDGKKHRFEFADVDAMKAALDVLPGLLNASLRVNVEWDQAKRKYKKCVLA